MINERGTTESEALYTHFNTPKVHFDISYRKLPFLWNWHDFLHVDFCRHTTVVHCRYHQFAWWCFQILPSNNTLKNSIGSKWNQTGLERKSSTEGMNDTNIITFTNRVITKTLHLNCSSVHVKTKKSARHRFNLNFTAYMIIRFQSSSKFTNLFARPSIQATISNIFLNFCWAVLHKMTYSNIFLCRFDTGTSISSVCVTFLYNLHNSD